MTAAAVDRAIEQCAAAILEHWDRTDSMPVKGMIVFEVLDGDGDRNIGWASSSSMQVWEIAGMLQTVRDFHQSAVGQLLNHSLDIDDDEEEPL